MHNLSQSNPSPHGGGGVDSNFYYCLMSFKLYLLTPFINMVKNLNYYVIYQNIAANVEEEELILTFLLFVL